MYKDVGEEIKCNAKAIVVLLTIPCVLLGIGVLVFLSDMISGFGGFLIGLVTATIIVVIGYFFARLSAILLYGYGELIARLCTLEERFCVCAETEPQRKKKKVERKEEKKDKWETDSEGTPLVKKNKDGTWNCLYCDHKNNKDAQFCENCGVEPVFK